MENNSAIDKLRFSLFYNPQKGIYTTTPTQSYHFAPESCPGGSQRAGSLSGTTTNANCPNVTKTATGKYACKSYDVTNSASSNYSWCYNVGDCDARYNSDGTRDACYA